LPNDAKSFVLLKFLTGSLMAWIDNGKGL